MEVERYLRIPFAYHGADWTGCNCWGLVALVYREERGIDLPLFETIAATDLRSVAREIKERGAAWRLIETPAPFDVAVMRGYSVANNRSMALNSHVGIVTPNGDLLHTEEGTGPVCLPIDDPLVEHRIFEVRRYHPHGG